MEFHLSAPRDAKAARGFFAKALDASHTVLPRVITVAKNAASPKAVTELKAAGMLPVACELRQSKYLNNLVEQDHRFMKRLVKPGMGFFSFETAWRTVQGYEVITMMRKGQMQGVRKRDSLRQATFIAALFAVAISTQQRPVKLCSLLLCQSFFATQPYRLLVTLFISPTKRSCAR